MARATTGDPARPGAGRRWLGGSLRRQLLVLLVPALAAMMALDTWLTYGTLREAANTAYDRSLYGSVRAIDNAIGMAGETIQFAMPDAAMEMFESTAQTRVFYRVSLERDGAIETLTGYEALPLPAGAPASLANNAPRFYDAVYRDEPVRIAALARPVYRPDARMRVIIQVAESSEPRAALIATVWRSALARDVLLILASAAILVGGITYVLRPLARVRDDVEARSPDDLAPLAFDTVPAEVRPLVDAVNRHVSRSAALGEAQAQFIADAAHQLRTPLAILKTQAEFARRQLDAGGDPAPAREAVGGIVTQLEQAVRLTNQLLALARVRQHAQPQDGADDMAGGEGDVAVIDAAAVAAQVALDYLPLARRKQQDFGWESPAGAGLPVRADAALLREALANLVHNAIQYSPRGSRITLSAARAGADACLVVEDDGPGIPPEERDKVFARFYRRVGHGQPGSGLGLAISREMAARFGGAVTLGDAAQGRGLRAELRLPLADTP